MISSVWVGINELAKFGLASRMEKKLWFSLSWVKSSMVKTEIAIVAALHHFLQTNFESCPPICNMLSPRKNVKK